MLVIMGGRSNNPDEQVSAIEGYDTEKSEWMRMGAVSRYRHAIALYNKTQLFIHGGFEPELASQPLESMISINLSPFYGQKALSNNWVESKAEMPEKEGRKALGQNDNFNNLQQTAVIPSQNSIQQALKQQPKRDVRDGGIENSDIPSQNNKMARNSRIMSTKPNFNKTAKERDLTPSRIINNIKNIRLSNQAVIAMG